MMNTIVRIDTAKIETRIKRIQRMAKGIQRVHKRVVKENTELLKELDTYHRQLFVVIQDEPKDEQ